MGPGMGATVVEREQVSTAVGNTTDKMKKGIKDAAGAVKHAVEKGKDGRCAGRG